jgi:hypothetical protein
MTEFTQTLRHYCRNQRCRSKLPSPVSNPRDAFCTRGCHSSFYRKRCLICECEMQRKTEHQLICGKRRCRNALQGRFSLGRYAPPFAVVSPLENPTKPGIKSGVANDRAWRIVADPEVAPHCATVGGTEAVEAINRTNARYWREANAKAEARALTQRHHSPVNVVGGYKFPYAPKIDLTLPVVVPSRLPSPVHIVGDDLEIPDFLKRSALRQAAPKDLYREAA